MVDVDGRPWWMCWAAAQIYTDANGKALIKYLAMGKYGVQVIPPTGSDWTGGHGSTPNVNGAWHQTATIEGTLTVDAWVKANEPMIFMEGFGPGIYHVFFGFVDPSKLAWATNPPTAAGVTLHGTNRFNHFGRPPNNQQFAAGPPVTEAWVGLNEFNAAGARRARALCRALRSGHRRVLHPQCPAGHLSARDLGQAAGRPVRHQHRSPCRSRLRPAVQELGNVLSFRWFGTYEGSVFYDDAERRTASGIPAKRAFRSRRSTSAGATAPSISPPSPIRPAISR